MQKLGKLDDSAFNFITTQEGLEFVQKANALCQPQEKACLSTLREQDYGPAPIIMQMLQFNPYLRPSAKELLAHPYFDAVRDPKMEISSEYKLLLDVDMDECYDCENVYTTLQLSELLISRVE